MKTPEKFKNSRLQTQNFNSKKGNFILVRKK